MYPDRVSRKPITISYSLAVLDERSLPGMLWGTTASKFEHVPYDPEDGTDYRDESLPVWLEGESPVTLAWRKPVGSVLGAVLRRTDGFSE
jgi:hypothetical protein